MSIFDDNADTDPVAFGRNCINAGRVNGASPHLLYAIAHDQSGVRNVPINGDDPAGLFMFDPVEWESIAGPLGFGEDQRAHETPQCLVAAKKVNAVAEALQAVLPDKRFATGAEIYLGWLIGTSIAVKILEAGRARTDKIDATLGSIPGIDVATLMTKRATLFKEGNEARSIADVLEAVAKLLDPGLKIAVEKIEEAQPGLFSAVDSATDATTTPWMVLAKRELDLPVQELSPAINKYFSDTGLGQGQNGAVAWCAAFVSWCIHQSTQPHKDLKYSALAGDWKRIGTEVQPVYGAIAVTVPLAKDSSGHVGFVVRFDDKRVFLLAGNQTPAGGGNGAVCIREFARTKILNFRMV